jgi:hypothetical protein
VDRVATEPAGYCAVTDGPKRPPDPAIELAHGLQNHEPRRRHTMLLALAVVLGIAWLLGLTVFKVSAVAFHLLIVLAVVGLIAHFARGTSRRLT